MLQRFAKKGQEDHFDEEETFEKINRGIDNGFIITCKSLGGNPQGTEDSKQEEDDVSLEDESSFVPNRYYSILDAKVGDDVKMLKVKHTMGSFRFEDKSHAMVRFWPDNALVVRAHSRTKVKLECTKISTKDLEDTGKCHSSEIIDNP